MIVAAMAVIAASSAFLFIYGVNLLYLSWRATRLPPSPARPASGYEERVAVQLPIFNERYVAERVIDAACSIDWPHDRLEVQVLDDSDDDTREIVSRRLERWRLAGVAVFHVRREHRAGYKAGALANGLTLTSAPFVAVFDADFVPRPDFLRRVMPAFTDPRVGFVQARWGHLNEGFSLFTYLQSLMTDFHFLVEQAVRPWLGHFTNFAGSAGVWRRAAIDDAGGWRATTLTEDLDLSYRVQLGGWKPAYLEDVVVPQELPVSASAYRGQQSRWATGSFQCAARLLWPLVRSRLSAGVKFQAALRLLGYVAPVAMLAQIGSYPFLLVGLAQGQHLPGLGLPVVASFMSLAPPTGMAVAQWRRGRDWWWHWYGLIGWTVLGAGTSLTVLASIWRAIRGGGEFKRTPKYRIERLGEEWRGKVYFKPALLGPIVELVIGLAGALLVWEAVRYGQPLLGAYTGLFAAGFLYLSGVSLIQSVRQVRYEVVAVRVRALLPRLRGPGLVAGMGLGLLLVAQLLPDPFEDSYQHWLIAANLATTGRLQDPLFQMQDTWLPAYHVLGALVLRLFGTWQLGALKSVDALIGVATLVITYRLAGTRRRGLIAVALLALNPIFVLTATSAVAEPLLVLFLLASVAAASERRMALAATFACLACLTGTKAWLWLGCVLAVLAAETFLRGAGSRRTAGRLAWVAPALALVLALQAAFGFASHSVARAAVEVGSATARGSLSASPLVRGRDFVGYFALASLPLVALAPFGLAASLRGHLGRRSWQEGSGRNEGDRSLLLVAWPSLLYLALVTALVVAGVYS
ncbi:MAG TPA: glycosyltransferase, partial [Candidatus Dormibacteraeota bacterium]|nr:glycosyltransferase [Candidatus Dormibacteraeota bacterium]